MGEHVLGEHGMRGVLADEAVRHGIGGIPAAVHVFDVQASLLFVQMRDDALEQRAEMLGIKFLEVLLPPDIAFDLRPGNREGVLDGAAGAAGVGVVDQRSVDAQLGGIGLGLVIRPVGANAAAIICDRLGKKLFLRQVVVIVDGIEPEFFFQRRPKIHVLCVRKISQQKDPPAAG